MAANTKPIFPLTPNSPVVTLTAKVAARDGSGSLTTLITAGANGSILYSVTFMPAQATAAAYAANVGNIFKTDANGANPKLIGSVTIPAVTISDSVLSTAYTFNWSNGMPLKAGELVKVAITVYNTAADDKTVSCNCWDY